MAVEVTIKNKSLFKRKLNIKDLIIWLEYPLCLYVFLGIIIQEKNNVWKVIYRNEAYHG